MHAAPRHPESTLEIAPLADAQCAAWDAFVQAHPEGTLYHLSGWRRIIEKAFGHATHYLAAREGRELVGVLPLVRLKSRLFGDFLVSMPYVNYGGTLGSSAAIEEQLNREACRLAMSLGVDHLELREQAPRPAPWVARHDKVAMIRPLPPDEATLWRELGSKCRAQVKRPLREGAEVIRGGAELLDDFYRVFSRNMRDLGTPVYPRHWFQTLLAGLGSRAQLLIVRLGEQPVAAGLLLGFRERLEIPWASSLREHNRLGVNMLLYWEALRAGIEHDYREFDFGRSTRGGGTYRFKRQWGAVPHQLHWHYWLARGDQPPRLNPDNPRYRMAIAVWQQLPLALANRLGPLIVRHLP